MQNRHTLQGVTTRSEPPASETESSDPGTRLRRAEELEPPFTADVPPGAEAKVVELSLSPTLP
jgi:hypothetical protein